MFENCILRSQTLPVAIQTNALELSIIPSLPWHDILKFCITINVIRIRQENYKCLNLGP